MPPLASVALEAVNFALGRTKQPQRQHEDGAMVGWSCFSAQAVLGRGTDETIGPRPVRTDSMNDRWAVYRSGDVTINWVEGDGGGRHNKLQHSYFSPEPIRGQGHPILLQTQQ